MSRERRSRLARDDVGVLFSLLGRLELAHRQQLAEHADERQRRLELVRHVGDEVALELVGALLLPRRVEEEGDAGEDGREHHRDEQELRAPAHALLGGQARGVGRRHLQPPQVQRRREVLLVEEAARVADRLAVANVVVLVADGERHLADERVEHLGEQVVLHVLDRDLEDDAVGVAVVGLLDERKEIVAAVVLGVQVLVVLDGQREQIVAQVGQHLLQEHGAEGVALLLADVAVGQKMQLFVEQEGGFDRRRDLDDVVPVLREVRRVVEIDELEQRAIGVDDAVLDAIDRLLAEEAIGFDQRLLRLLRDLRGVAEAVGAERDRRRQHHRHDHVQRRESPFGRLRRHAPVLRYKRWRFK